MTGLTFDGEPSYNVPDLRHDDDSYMDCERCGGRTYMGDPTCGKCGEVPVAPVHISFPLFAAVGSLIYDPVTDAFTGMAGG